MVADLGGGLGAVLVELLGILFRERGAQGVGGVGHPGGDAVHVVDRLARKADGDGVAERVGAKDRLVDAHVAGLLDDDRRLGVQAGHHQRIRVVGRRLGQLGGEILGAAGIGDNAVHGAAPGLDGLLKQPGLVGGGGLGIVDDGEALGAHLRVGIIHQRGAEGGVAGAQLEHPLALLAGRLQRGAGALAGGQDLGRLRRAGDGDVVVGVVRPDDGHHVLVRGQLQVGVGGAHVGAQRVLNLDLDIFAQHAAGVVDLFFHDLGRVGRVAALAGAVAAQGHGQADLDDVARGAAAAAAREESADQGRRCQACKNPLFHVVSSIVLCSVFQKTFTELSNKKAQDR